MNKNRVLKDSLLKKRNAVLFVLALTFFCSSSALQVAPVQETNNELENELPSNQKNEEEIVTLSWSAFPEQPIDLPEPPLTPHPMKSSFVAVGLTSLFPGLGHLYLGDFKTAGSLIGCAGLGVGGTYLLPNQKKDNAFLTLQNIWCYGIYAAYRDARRYNGQLGCQYKMPMESFDELALAPFNLTILQKPEVWGGLLGKFALVVALTYFTLPKEHIKEVSVRGIFPPFISLPVGLGEESLFRGFLQSSLSEFFTPWGGITLSSLLFGTAHLSNTIGMSSQDRKEYYRMSIPIITTAGFYYGWLTYKNHSLQESVALHTWYDFIIIALGSLAGESIFTRSATCTLKIPF